MRVFMTGALVGLIACAPSGPADDRPPEEESDRLHLATSLVVRIQDDSVRFRLDVTNTSGEALVLEFATAQRVEFTVLGGTGAVEWRSSADQMYAQVMGADTIAPGATRSWEAAWEPGARTGEWIATGTVSALNQEIGLQTTFELLPD